MPTPQTLNGQPSMSRIVQRPSLRRAADSPRQTTVVIALAVLLGVGLFASGEYVTSRQRPAAPAPASNDDEIYTGSILYMPYDGRLCRQFLFDNHTGRLSDNGSVDCESAAYQGTDSAPKLWSFARARAISTGFHDR
jgi:hypothetical protein